MRMMPAPLVYWDWNIQNLLDVLFPTYNGCWSSGEFIRKSSGEFIRRSSGEFIRRNVIYLAFRRLKPPLLTKPALQGEFIRRMVGYRRLKPPLQGRRLKPPLLVKPRLQAVKALSPISNNKRTGRELVR